MTVLAATLLLGSAAVAADSPKLAAPLYKEAVPAILAEGVQVDPFYTATFGGVKALDCQSLKESRDIAGKPITAEEAKQAGYSPGPWCFLTRDPIDKVRAFYEKALGPMHVIKGTWGQHGTLPVQGYAVYTERAWFPGDGESSSPGFGYHAVSLHALPSPPVRGKEAKTTDDTWEGQEAYKFYAETRHFGGFIEAVDWFGDPSKRKPAELDAVYKKHNRLESALFQRKGPDSEPVDEILRSRYAKQREQEMKKAFSMMPGQGQMSQIPQVPTPLPADQYATPEDAEFNAFMKRHPEVARKYTELTKKLGTLMQQGRFDEADAVDEELQQLTQKHPELAALERRAEERSAAASAAGRAQENRAMANVGKQQDQAVWGTWMDYITAAEKEAYYTLIVIDTAFRGNEKDYSRDRSLFEEWTTRSAPHTPVLDFRYDTVQTSAGHGTASSDATPPSQPGTGENVKENIMKGLKGLKKLF